MNTMNPFGVSNPVVSLLVLMVVRTAEVCRAP